VVVLVMCTDTLVPAGMSPRMQLKVWVGAVPVIEQLPWAGPVLIDQLTPDPPGSGSLTVTERATPVAAAPELATETVNPIRSPALTVATSAVLVIDGAGGWIPMVAEADTLGALVAEAVAVLG